LTLTVNLMQPDSKSIQSAQSV